MKKLFAVASMLIVPLLVLSMPNRVSQPIRAAANRLGVPIPCRADIPARIRSIIEQIDLKCYRIEGGEPLNLELQLDHLNPVFQEMGLPPEQVIVREPQQLCVPVAKNGLLPPEEILQLIQYIDLKCYRIEADPEPLNLPLRLDHLNPLFRKLGLPPEQVRVLQPEQLCVPVAKNGLFPPDEVLQIIQHIDLKGYRIVPPIPLNLPLRLDHLNPLFRKMGLPPEQVRVVEPQLLYVPVAKNGLFPPEEILPLIQYIDLKGYRIEPPIPLNLPLQLDHLNPLFREMGLPPEQVILLEPQRLLVPVAKNGQFPPD